MSAQTDPGERELVSMLAEAALAQAAPEELALFPEIADEYFSDPDAVLDPRPRDEAVGFGLDLALVTPVLLAIATPVIQLLTSVAQEAVADGLKPSVTRLVRRMLRGGAPDGDGGAPLTDEQIRRVRATAYARAHELGLDDVRAGLLADSLVGGLVVTRP